MNKDFQKFQNDFYYAVGNNFPMFYESIDTLQIVKSDVNPDLLVMFFAFTELTGKRRCESFYLTYTEDLDSIINEVKSNLVEDYPAWVRFNSLEEAVATVIETNDPDNTYEFDVENEDGESHSLELTIGNIKGIDQLVIRVVDDEDGVYFNYSLDFPVKDIVECVMFELFGE